MSVWANEELILTGDISNAPEILKSGHIIMGFDGNDNIDAYLDYATFTFKRLLTDVTDKPNTTIKSYQLYQNYPNPFNPSTTIKYQIPKSDNVSLKIYDILGNEIAVLVNEIKPAGIHTNVFNANALSSGIYFYRLQTSAFSETKKLLLIK